MNLNQYDDALALHYEKLTVKSSPIVCWDLYSEFVHQLKLNFSDSTKLLYLAKTNRWVDYGWDYKTKLQQDVIIVTNSNLKIVFASQNITQMNGYKEAEVLGKSPKMFHGLDTDQKISGQIREAIQLQVPFEKTVLNYKKNGESYICHIKGFPIFDTKGILSHFIAFENVA
jgi:PAS domain S-box-containing protein